MKTFCSCSSIKMMFHVRRKALPFKSLMKAKANPRSLVEPPKFKSIFPMPFEWYWP